MCKHAKKSHNAFIAELSSEIDGKTILSGVKISIASIIVSTIIGTILLTIAYMLPVTRMIKNVSESAVTIREEGRYPILTSLATSKLDNFTDSIMLLEVADETPESALKNAMNAPMGLIDNKKPDDVLTNHYIDGVPFTDTMTYARYWHGYLILLKPLFIIFDYNSIRFINGIVQLALIVLTCYLMNRNGLSMAIPPFILSYFMLMPLALAKSFQYSSCFYVFILGCIALLIMKLKHMMNLSHIVFLYCGILTAYFDFLTYPLVTLCMPLLFYMITDDSSSIGSKTVTIISSGLFWCIGFAGMWVSKWLIGSIITHENIIANGLGRVAMRTGSASKDGSEHYSSLACISGNYKAFFMTPVSYAVVIYIAYLFFKIARLRTLSSLVGSEVILYLLVAIAPIIWFALTTNHSTIHTWFVNKSCVVSLLAFLFALLSLSKPQGDTVS